MNLPIILAITLIAMPARAQYGYGGLNQTKSPQDQEAIKEISETFQNIQAEMMAISQNSAGMDLEKQKNLAEQVRRLDANLKKYADPAGLLAAMTSFTATVYGVQTQIYRANGSNLRTLAHELKAVDNDLAKAVGPEILEKMRSGRKAGSAKGSLGAFRSALSIFYGDKEGKYPSTVAEMIPKYLSHVPSLDIPNHKPSSEVRTIKGVQTMAELKTRLKDSGQWLLVTDPASKIAGTILIDCTHTDNRGTLWNSY